MSGPGRQRVVGVGGGGRGVVRQVDEQYFEAGPAGTPRNHAFEVFLDGERRPLAVMAHAGQGWVTSRVVDAAGEIVRDGMGNPKHRVEHGKVELRRCND